MGLHTRPGGLVVAPADRPVTSLLLSTAAAIAVTAVVFGSVGVADRGSTRAQTTTVSPSDATPAPQATVSQSPSESVDPVAFPPPPTALRRPTVELRWTHGPSWVRVVDSKGVVVINDIYDKGTVKQFTGPSFFVEMGNAGAITLIQKGGQPRMGGKTGESARWTVIGP